MLHKSLFFDTQIRLVAYCSRIFTLVQRRKCQGYGNSVGIVKTANCSIEKEHTLRRAASGFYKVRTVELTNLIGEAKKTKRSALRKSLHLHSVEAFGLFTIVQTTLCYTRREAGGEDAEWKPGKAARHDIGREEGYLAT